MYWKMSFVRHILLHRFVEKFEYVSVIYKLDFGYSTRDVATCASESE